MAKSKFQWKRPELSIAEVREQYDCTVEDIFHEAAIGELTLYVKTEAWKVGAICSINPVILSTFPESKHIIKAEDFEAIFPEFKDIKSKDDIAEKADMALKRASEEMVNNLPTDGFQEITKCGLLTFYPSNGIYRAIYNSPILGFQPISATAVAMYRNGMGGLGIFLKLINDFGIADNSMEEFVIIPNPFFDVKEALNNDMLFVMKADLQKLVSNETTLLKSEVPNKKASRQQTLERYADWQKRADDKIKKNPALSTYAVAELIHADLEREKSKLIRSVNAIRQHIKI